MKVLLVEDDPRISSFVAKGLEEEGFSVAHTSEGETGLHLLLTESFDAAIVDVMLPRLDGLELIKRVRHEKKLTPILVLSAKDAVDDRIKGLEMGCDDYMVKPFAFSELVARLHALIRRSQSIAEPNTLSVGDLNLDMARRKVFREEKEIDLQPREFMLLEYLLRNAGRVVSKTMIMENVWEYNFDPQTNVVEARMCRLRDKIDRPFEDTLIHTVRGVGYVLEERP
jgi:DNA-binding response OmpR family regulator